MLKILQSLCTIEFPLNLNEKMYRFRPIIVLYFRWRKLGGKDPPTLELIQKIQTLQKRLIARKEDIVDRETSIREKVTTVDRKNI